MTTKNYHQIVVLLLGFYSSFLWAESPQQAQEEPQVQQTAEQALEQNSPATSSIPQSQQDGAGTEHEPTARFLFTGNRLDIHQAISAPPEFKLYFSADTFNTIEEVENTEQAQSTEQNTAQSSDPSTSSHSAGEEQFSDYFNATIGQWSTEITEVNPVDSNQDGIALVFLVDISKSLIKTQFKQIQAALTQWVEQLGENDQAAIVTFGSQVTIKQAYTSDKALLAQKISELALTDNNTLVYQGIAQALQLAKTIDATLPSRRAIITLTDGIDDNAGGLTKEELIEQLKVDPLPLYAIGYYRLPKTNAKDNGVKQLGILARRSGGQYFSALEQSFDDIYQSVRQAINDTWKITLNCSECIADGQIYRLQLSLLLNQVNGSQRQLTNGMNIRLLPPINEPAIEEPIVEEPEPQVVAISQPAPKKPTLIEKYGLYAGIGIVVLVLLWFLMRKKKTVEVSEEIEESEIIVDEYDDEDIPTQQNFIAVEPEIGEDSWLGQANISLINMNNQETHKIKYREPITIGRSASNEIQLQNDDEISGQHCSLLWNEQKKQLLIQDLDSTNGTYINGVPISRDYVLAEHDVITVGRYNLRIITIQAET